MAAEQEIWVQNPTIPCDLLEHQYQPWTVQNTWMSEFLSMTMSNLSGILMMHRIVPITVHVGPFRSDSKNGQVFIIMGTYFTLLETIGIRAQLQKNMAKTTKKLMEIALNDGWP
ncbi:hypothetical protein BGZ51_008545 [Haplosporangium sp. Z 767]|nr:hypothetical protein BGZ51_008545 [Haplosporangium sp. Z 767]KAF9196857.1 hypothetical protein BGZ50_005931 [Haplosporangium sp. Z 11]